ncbi:class I SAM-dependent methyltransferase [uncultured Sphingomonas sp.]|uniref:class I SAM-dependent methyltransferase n=1 Tax=uncultured Sphingomonas sp. TaxID=158754 RepID=UPI0035CB660F
MRALIPFAPLLLAPLLLAAATAPVVSPAIRAALADPARADQAGDDLRRQAAAVIAFSGAKPGDTVVDYLPGQGYWTRIFTGVVGPNGHVIAMWPQAGARRAAAIVPGLQAKALANVAYDVQAGNLPVVAQPVDLFWTVQSYHDIPEGLRTAFNAAVFRALKPGGTYLIIDHADARGALPTTPSKHRIDPAVVRSQVASAGFRFTGQSTVLANPADDHSKPVFDPTIRGQTDQFVFRFVRPK